jgi:hypothetical protein
LFVAEVAPQLLWLFLLHNCYYSNCCHQNVCNRYRALPIDMLVKLVPAIFFGLRSAVEAVQYRISNAAAAISPLNAAAVAVLLPLKQIYICCSSCCLGHFCCLCGSYCSCHAAADLQLKLQHSRSSYYSGHSSSISISLSSCCCTAASGTTVAAALPAVVVLQLLLLLLLLRLLLFQLVLLLLLLFLLKLLHSCKG